MKVELKNDVKYTQEKERRVQIQMPVCAVKKKIFNQSTVLTVKKESEHENCNGCASNEQGYWWVGEYNHWMLLKEQLKHLVAEQLDKSDKGACFTSLDLQYVYG